uniref:snRNA-activating protein complex subunit 4 n=1 Tax=Glossina brevipalpis TaxID=37001 RepID=A0A1A9X2N2_9MUSC
MRQGVDANIENERMPATACVEKALQINQQIQNDLFELRNKLQKMLINVQDSFNVNEELLKNKMKRNRQGIGIRGAYLRGGTFYLKGNMFFKDLNCRNCPNNQDYERRKREDNELFPMDLELCGRHVWSLKDKQDIVHAIKEQVIEYFRDRDNVELQKYHSTQVAKNEKLVKLLSYAGENFHIDWHQISTYNLRRRHSPSSCEAIWNVYLHPMFKRIYWSPEENKKLLEVAKKFNFQNWPDIAAEMGKRSDFQCFVQYQNSVCYMLPERWTKWSKEDDKRLIEIVNKYTFNSVINWNNIMAHFPHKPKTTIQARYSYTLNPLISHAPFTPEEDLLLLAAVKEYGAKFSCFPKTLFPNRTVVQLRSRYQNTILHRHKRTSWSVDDDRKLMGFVTENGTSSWLKCAEYLGNHHTRISCRTRYITIQTFLKKNPQTVIEDIPRKKQYTPVHNINAENWTQKLAELNEDPNAIYNAKKRLSGTRKLKESNQKEKQMIKSLNKDKRKKNYQRCRKTLENEKNRNRANYETSIISCEQNAHKHCRKNPIYMERLRSIGSKMYEFFKYSYNFRVAEDVCRTVPHEATSTYIVAAVLGFNLKSNCVFGPNIPNRLVTQYRSLLERGISNDIQILARPLPCNWSSATAFRALCVLTSRSDESLTSLATDLVNNNPSVMIFRQRLRTLLYTAALLSRLHPSLVGINTEQNCYKVKNENAAMNSELIKGTSSVKRKKIIKGPQSKRICSELPTQDIKTEIET